MTSTDVHPPAASTTPARRAARVLRPLSDGGVRRTAYLVLSFPAGLLCLLLSLVGAGRTAARTQRALARTLLRTACEEPRRTGPFALLHAVISTPLSLLGVAVTVYGWVGLAINLGYPLRSDAGPALDWGGPTLAGAWGVHAAGGTVLFLAMTWAGRGITVLQSRLVTALLGERGAGTARAVLPAVLTAAVGAVLAVPVVHQL